MYMSDVETCPIATKFCIIIREILVALALVCFVCNITVDFERALGSFRKGPGLEGTSRNEGGWHSHLYRWERMWVRL
jgi:hypothetical protein